MDFHSNIISFYGITKIESGMWSTKILQKVSKISNYNQFFLIIYLENKLSQTGNYLLVMEYADDGTLRDYLKDNFKTLTWSDKYNLAYQLAYALTCMHDEGIVHRDLVIILRILYDK